jgi:hypothetical protein
MGQQFFNFLRSLPSARHGYCVECLSSLYGEPVEAIGAYLGRSGITSSAGECRNCGEHKPTFRPGLQS